jgi:uncharacterized protein YwqG
MTDNPENTNAIEWAKSVAKPAIGLTRIYPISRYKGQRSRIGGLPDLPEWMEWPRSTYDEFRNCRLHFMAQIDLAELPWQHPMLPSLGTLLFFASFDEELAWSGDSEAVCVCFDPTSAGQPTQPPEDLEPREGGNSSIEDFLLPDEQHPVLLDSWPLQATAMLSFPGLTIWPEELRGPDDEKNCDKIINLQASHFTKSFSLSKIESYRSYSSDQVNVENLGWTISHAKRPDTLSELCFDDAVKVKRFTELWLRRVYRDFDKRLSSLKEIVSKGYSATNIANIELLRPILRPLIAEIEACSNKDWENSSLQRRVREILPQISDFFYYNNKRELENMLHKTVRECGKDSELAALIPYEWLMVAENEHVAFQRHGRDKRELHCHQMFGHITNSQWSAGVDDTDICLLQIRSDKGNNLMICDVGEMEFWIKPEDLAKLDFSKVWGTTQGH